MSVVVVVKKAGRAVIAADSQTSFGSTKLCPPYDASATKLHRVGTAYVGLVGDAVHHDVFGSLIEKHPGDFSFQSKRHIFETALRIHPHLKEKFFLETREDKDGQSYESSQLDCLIAAPSGIFGLYSYREVHEFGKFWAMGSGMRLALGAMFASYDRLESPEEIARMGIAAATEFDSSCAGPVWLETVNLIEKTAPNGSGIAGGRKVK